MTHESQNVNRMKAILSKLFAPTVIVAVALSVIDSPRSSGYVLVDSEDHPLESIFSPSANGRSEITTVDLAAIEKSRKKLTSCQKSSGLLSRLGLEVQSVYAANCEPGNCSGHYMHAYNTIQCAQGCDGWRVLYWSDPFAAEWSSGTQYTGEATVRLWIQAATAHA